MPEPLSAAATILPDRGVIEVAGADAQSFLQGLITNDVAKVSAEHSIYAALLTPQGKVIYDFLIFGADGGYILDCVKVHAPDLAARLRRYKLRAKVTITDRSSDLAIAVSRSNDLPNAVKDPRLDALGYRAIVAAAASDQEAALAYQRLRLDLGVPDSATDIPPETYFPLDCNFEELHGVDFDKGCYVGQELTARMKHRASARRRMLPVHANAPLPPPGTPLKIGSSDIGELRGSIGNRGLALVRLDRLGDAVEATADAITVTIGRPTYPLILAGVEAA